MRASRRLIVQAALAGLLVCAGLWYLDAHLAERAPPETLLTTSVQSTGPSAALQSPPPAGEAVVLPPQAPVEQPISVTGRVAKKRAATQFRRVHGSVVVLNGKLPREGVIVEVATEVDTPVGRGLTSVQADTDSEGRFTLDLFDDWPEGALCEFQVYLHAGDASARRYFHGPRRQLVEGVEIPVDLSSSPHGVVYFD